MTDSRSDALKKAADLLDQWAEEIRGPCSDADSDFSCEECPAQGGVAECRACHAEIVEAAADLRALQSETAKQDSSARVEKWRDGITQVPQPCACRFEWRPMPDFSGAPPKQLEECGFHAEKRREKQQGDTAKDAARYRWLRPHLHIDSQGDLCLERNAVYVGPRDGIAKVTTRMDAAIDAALLDGNVESKR